MLKDKGTMANKSMGTVSINAVGLAYILGRNDLDDIIATKTKMLRQEGNRNIDNFLSFIRQIKRQDENLNHSN
jgi:hypothetical protein